MMRCKYCDLRDEYAGEFFELSKNIDGKNQNFKMYICFDEESTILNVSGMVTDLTVDIKFCPMCGESL